MAGKNDDTNVDSNYGDRPGNIPKPNWETISDKSYLLGNLQEDGSFNYSTLQFSYYSLSMQSTEAREVEARSSQIKQMEERYRKLENSVDKAIYKLLDISCDEVGSEEKIKYIDIADGSTQTETKSIKKIIPNIELRPEQRQRFYNMKYYIFSNLLEEKPHLSNDQCENFMKNLDKNLLKLEDGDTALNYLQGTSDVTKLTYILGAATEGKQPITNLNYIKDSNAEIILRRETGAFFTHSVDDYMRYWDKKSMADMPVDTFAFMKQEASLEKLGAVVALACMTIATVAAIVLTPISMALAATSAAVVGVAGIASYLLIPYFGKQLVTQDNYSFLLDDVNKKMENIDSLNTGKAFELLGTVDSLLRSTPDNTKLQNYKKQLEELKVVQDTKNNKGFKKMTDIISKEVNTVNEAYNNRLTTQIGLGRKRKTAEQKEGPDVTKLDDKDAALNTPVNEDLNQSFNENFNENLKSNEDDQKMTNLDESKNNLTNKSVSTDTFPDVFDYPGGNKTYKIKDNTKDLRELDKLHETELKSLVMSKDSEINKLQKKIDKMDQMNKIRNTLKERGKQNNKIRNTLKERGKQNRPNMERITNKYIQKSNFSSNSIK